MSRIDLFNNNNRLHYVPTFMLSRILVHYISSLFWVCVNIYIFSKMYETAINMIKLQTY